MLCYYNLRLTCSIVSCYWIDCEDFIINVMLYEHLNLYLILKVRKICHKSLQNLAKLRELVSREWTFTPGSHLQGAPSSLVLPSWQPPGVRSYEHGPWVPDTWRMVTISKIKINQCSTHCPLSARRLEAGKLIFVPLSQCPEETFFVHSRDSIIMLWMTHFAKDSFN